MGLKPVRERRDRIGTVQDCIGTAARPRRSQKFERTSQTASQNNLNGPFYAAFKENDRRLSTEIPAVSHQMPFYRRDHSCCYRFVLASFP